MTFTLPFELPCAECRSRTCAVYCEADAAYLCTPCDTLVHSANRLAGRHVRRPVSFGLCSPCSATQSVLGEELDHLEALEEADALVPDIATCTDLAIVAGQYVQREAAVLATSAARKWSVNRSLASTELSNDKIVTNAVEYSAVSDVALTKKEEIRHTVNVERTTEEDVDAQKFEKRKERLAALQRFRNKRASRSFVKKVRYECRKQLADSRPRVKGRFVKKCEMSLYKKYGDDYRSHLHEVDLISQQDCIAPNLNGEMHAVLPDPLSTVSDIQDISDISQPLSVLS